MLRQIGSSVILLIVSLSFSVSQTDLGGSTFDFLGRVPFKPVVIQVTSAVGSAAGTVKDIAGTVEDLSEKATIAVKGADGTLTDTDLANAIKKQGDSTAFVGDVIEVVGDLTEAATDLTKKIINAATDVEGVGSDPSEVASLLVENVKKSGDLVEVLKESEVSELAA